MPRGPRGRHRSLRELSVEPEGRGGFPLGKGCNTHMMLSLCWPSPAVRPAALRGDAKTFSQHPAANLLGRREELAPLTAAKPCSLEGKDRGRAVTLTAAALSEGKECCLEAA